MPSEQRSSDKPTGGHHRDVSAGDSSKQLLILFLGIVVGTFAALYITLGLSILDPYPWHHDEFSIPEFLTWKWLGYQPRPLTGLVWRALCSIIPLPIGKYHYILPFLFICVYTSLASQFVFRWFEWRFAHAWVGLFAMTIGFLIGHYEDAAHITGYLVSVDIMLAGIFGILSVRTAECTMNGSHTALLPAIAFFMASVFYREDFLLFIVSATGISWTRAFSCTDGTIRIWDGFRARRGLLVLVLFFICTLLLGCYTVYTGGATYSGVGAYRTDLSPTSLVQSTFQYLTATRMMCTFSLLFLVALLGNIVIEGSVWSSSGMVIIVLALVFPFTPLTNHFGYHYIFNWLPFMVAVVLGFTIRMLSSKKYMKHSFLTLVCLVMAIGLSIYASRLARTRSAEWFVMQHQKSKQIVLGISKYIDALSTFSHSSVVIEGLGDLMNPWSFAADKHIETIFGSSIKWIIKASPDDKLWGRWNQLNLLQSNNNRQSVVQIVAENSSTDWCSLPVIRFDKELNSRLILPGEKDPLVLSLGETVFFGSGKSGTTFMASGFSSPDIGVCWTEAFKAKLRFRLPDQNNGHALQLTLKAIPYVPQELGDDRYVDVYFCGVRIAQWPLRSHQSAQGMQEYRARIDASLLQSDRVSELLFVFSELRPPASIKPSYRDQRLLGLAFGEMVIEMSRPEN